MPLSWPTWIIGAIGYLAIAAAGLLAMALRLVARALEACADQIMPVPQALPSGQAEQDNGLYLGQAPMSPEQISALRQLYQKPTLRKLVDELVEDYLAEDTAGSSSGASSSGPAAANGQSASSARPSGMP